MSTTDDGGDDDVASVEEIEQEMGIFSGVVGHNGAKAIVRGALRDGTVHVMLTGPPASGKSTILHAIEENVPGTVYRDCERFTATQVQSMFAQDPPILLLDEFDALGDYDVLSNPLEHGRVTEDKQGETYDIEIGTQVIAACNAKRMVPGNIQSRFREVPFEGYDDEEVIEVCVRMLPQSIDWIESEEQARTVAKTVQSEMGTNDPRDIRDVAKLASSVGEIEDLCLAMTDADADVDSEPLRPGEVERAKGEVGKERLKGMVSEERRGAADEPAPDEEAHISPEEVDEEMDQAVREEFVKEIAEKGESEQ